MTAAHSATAQPETTVKFGHAAVAICTRDRPFLLARALSSLVRSGERPCEVIVVDQSRTNQSLAVAERYARFLPGLRTLRDPRVGASAAHNLAVASSRAAVVVFTDDDCEVTAGWMTGLIRALQQSPRAGIAFGSVHAAEHDTRSSFIVNYEPRERRELRGRLGKLKDGGIGANMAIRTDAVRQVGWFDESLGPGAEFHACLDGDIAYRMLARGWSVVHVPESSVWHHGKRDLSSSGPAVRRTYQGIGACYFKYVRSGELAGVLLLGQQYLLVSRDVLRAAVSGRRPLGIGKLIGLTAGIWFSRRRAVDRSTLRYASE